MRNITIHYTYIHVHELYVYIYVCIYKKYIYIYIHIYIYTRIHSDWAVDLGSIKSPALPNSGRAMSRTGRQVSRAGSPGWSPGWSPRSPGAMAVLRIFGQNIIDNVLSWKKKENLTIMDYVINIKESIIHLSLPKFRKCWKILEINLGLLRLQMGNAQFFFVQQTLGSARRDRMIPQLGFLWFPPQQVGFKCSWFMGLVKMLVYIAVSFSSFESLGKHRALGNTSQTLQNPRWWPRVVGLLWFIYIDLFMFNQS